MTPHMIRQLPAGRALIIRGACSPVIGRIAAAWKDPRYKAYRVRGRPPPPCPRHPAAPATPGRPKRCPRPRLPGPAGLRVTRA